jgi:invasion protein IalB
MVRAALIASLAVTFSSVSAVSSGLPPSDRWEKTCGADHDRHDVCYTARSFFSDGAARPTLAVALYDYRDLGTHVLRFLVPTGIRTDQGISFSLEGAAAGMATIKTCFPNGCFAEAEVSDSFVQELTEGRELQVGIPKGQTRFELRVSTSGFGEAYSR